MKEKKRVFCKDCKFPNWNGLRFKCKAKKIITYCPIVGKEEWEVRCLVRNKGMDCKHFEKKEPPPKKKTFWQKIMNRVEGMIDIQLRGK